MLITLAYPWDGFAPDDTIEVVDAVGKQLIRDGKARAADDDAEPVEPLELDAGVTMSEAKAYAVENGVSVRDAAKALRETRVASDQPPATGDDPKE